MKKLTVNFYTHKMSAYMKVVRHLDDRPLPDHFSSFDPKQCQGEFASPLTGCVYHVANLVDDKDQFAGFKVSFEAGACAVNSPLLHHNNMPLACRLGQALLKNAILSKGYSPEVMNLLDLEQCEIVKATAGYYVPVNDRTAANNVVGDMAKVLEGLHNYRSSQDDAHHDRLQFHGSPLNGHWKLRRKHHSVKFYPMNDPNYWLAQSAYDWYETAPSDESFERCQHFVFIEVEVDRDWLTKHELDYPVGWEGGDRHGCDLMWELVRRDFGLEAPLTTEPLDEQALGHLSAQDRDLVKGYFKGMNVRKHPVINGLADPKRAFRLLRQRVKALVGLDLSIPWYIVCSHLRGRDAASMLVTTNDFGLPQEQEQFVFGSPRYELKLP